MTVKVITIIKEMKKSKIIGNQIVIEILTCFTCLFKTHQKKIRNLTNNIALPFTLNETIHNLSTIIATEELDVLKYGLKHPIHTLHVNKTDVLITFEFIPKTMTKDLKHEKQSGGLKAKLLNFIKVCYEETQDIKTIMQEQ